MSDESVELASPVYGGFASPPPTYPLGICIADKVTIKEIDRRTADRMYIAHHEYLPRGRCGWHFGVYLNGRIVGAISFDNWPSQASIRGYESEEIIEVSRVCIAHDTPNLASCAMSKAQDRFISEHDGTVKLLITYIHEEWDGSMFAALSGKGWEQDGISEGRARKPHDDTGEIHEIFTLDKERWVCEIE